MLRRASAATLALASVFAVGLPGGPALAPAPAHADGVRDRVTWVLRALDADQAWRTTRGRGVTVGLVDTGTDGGHPDLVGNVRAGPDFLADVAHHPKRLHGTLMASLIAGHGHGASAGDGVLGIAPEAKVLSVRAIADDEEPGFAAFRHGPAYRAAVPKAIRYATDNGADVINLSLGGPGASRQDRDAVAYAVSKGVVVVAAAGNDGASKNPRKVGTDGLTRLSYPAAFPGVIAVAAVGKGHHPARFSDRNASVTVAAPGDDVIAAGPGTSYWVGGGTSQACAMVSGVAALVKARYPTLAPGLVGQAITASARSRPASGYDESVGFGEVNAAGALAEAARLSRYRVSGSARPGRFGDGQANPVRVVRHPPGLVFLGGWVGVAALFGLGGALTTVGLYVRRSRRDSTLPGQGRPVGEGAPGGGPPGEGPPGGGLAGHHTSGRAPLGGGLPGRGPLAGGSQAEPPVAESPSPPPESGHAERPD